MEVSYPQSGSLLQKSPQWDLNPQTSHQHSTNSCKETIPEYQEVVVGLMRVLSQI